MSNPYEVTSVSEPFPSKPGVIHTGPWEMQYMESFNYIFNNPNWMMNIVWGLLCFISTAVIPVVGQLVYMGYTYEVVDALHRSNGRWYPDFDVNRFGDYLSRALGPFVVSLVATLVLIPVGGTIVFACFMLPIAIAGAAQNDTAAAIGFAVGMFLGFIGVFVVSLITNFILGPLMLRGGLTANVGESFQFGWAIEFAKKTWVEMMLAGLFGVLAGFVLMFLGLLAFCIGIYVAAPIAMLMGAHFQFQFYRVFLSRGGEPIPLSDKVKPLPFM